MKFIKRNFIALSSLVVIVFLPIISFAEETAKRITNPIKYDTIDAFIKVVLEGAIKIGIPVIALAIIYSGFLFVSAQGNSEKLKTARKSLTYSVIGAAILLGAWAIAQLITTTVLAL